MCAGKPPRFRVAGPVIVGVGGALGFLLLWGLVQSQVLTVTMYMGALVIWGIVGWVVCLLVKGSHEGASGMLEWIGYGMTVWDNVADGWWLGFAGAAIAAIGFMFIR